MPLYYSPTLPVSSFLGNISQHNKFSSCCKFNCIGNNEEKTKALVGMDCQEGKKWMVKLI
jgi:hypothetical protein